MMAVRRAANPGGAMFGIPAGRGFDGQRVVPGGALVLVDNGRIAASGNERQAPGRL
jgi:imidazolonepropionase-like amidohydrolase